MSLGSFRRFVCDRSDCLKQPRWNSAHTGTGGVLECGGAFSALAESGGFLTAYSLALGRRGFEPVGQKGGHSSDSCFDVFPRSQFSRAETEGKKGVSSGE